jgi:hypothetical protein
MTTHSDYYVYYYLRSVDSVNGKKGTPYYVGKGRRDRINEKHTVKLPVDSYNRIKIAEGLTNENACRIERLHIRLWGRINIGTGCLRNLTNGGEGTEGRITSLETIKKQSEKSKEWYSVPENKTFMLQQWNNAETNKKRSSSLKKSLSKPEIKAQRSDIQKELWKDPQIRENRIKAFTEAQNRPEVKEHLRTVNRQPEILEKKRQIALEQWKDPNHRAKWSESRRLSDLKPETKANRSQAQKMARHDPKNQRTCEWCGKTCYVTAYATRHGDKCKSRLVCI